MKKGLPKKNKQKKGDKKKRNHAFKTLVLLFFFPVSAGGLGTMAAILYLMIGWLAYRANVEIRQPPKPREGLVPGRESGKYCTWRSLE